MTLLYRIIARLNGWRPAYDVETNALVVWHDRLGRHYSGPQAWKQACLCALHHVSNS